MKKKILFVINTMGRAGAETALLTLLSKLAPEYECYLYVLMGQGELICRVPEEVQLLNHNYTETSVLEKSGKRDMYRNILHAMRKRGTVLKRLPQLCRDFCIMAKKGKVYPDKLLWHVLSDGAEFFEQSFDLAVAFLEGGATYYVADHVKAKKKAAFVHTDYTKAGYDRRMDENCYEKYDRIFPISEEVQNSFLKVYPEYRDRTKVFHNIIDRNEILKKAKLPGGFTDAYDGIRILTVGRLTELKAYPVAIEAMRLLKEAGVRARWYVLGEGPERAKLEKLIAEAGLEQDFFLHGAVDNPYPYYAQADLYVHATQYEGKSIAIQEAQILGRAVVASDRSGNREQIQSGEDGILCDLTAEAVKDSVIYLLQNPTERKKMEEAAAGKMMCYEDDLQLLTNLLA